MSPELTRIDPESILLASTQPVSEAVILILEYILIISPIFLGLAFLAYKGIFNLYKRIAYSLASVFLKDFPQILYKFSF